MLYTVCVYTIYTVYTVSSKYNVILHISCLLCIPCLMCNVYSGFHQSVKFIQYTDMDYIYHIHIIVPKNKVLSHVVSHGNKNLIYEFSLNFI